MITKLNDLGQPVIQLTQDNYKNCLIISGLIQLEVENRKAKTTYDANPLLSEAIKFCGLLGEQAVANYFDYVNVYRPYSFRSNDVLGYEVRATYHENGCLLTHALDDKHYGDKPGRYILVTIDQLTQEATLRGFSTLKRCNERKDNYQTSWRYPCFAMPQNQLWPIDMLPATDELIKHQTEKAA